MNKLYEEQSIQDIADAIREKNGSSDTYTVAQMGDAVRDLNTKWVVPNRYNANNISSADSGTTLDISNWDFSQVTEPIGLFAALKAQPGGFNYITGLEDLDTSRFTTMERMFEASDSYRLQARDPSNPLNLSSWDVSNVTDMSYMFSRTYTNGSSDLRYLNLGWNDTSSLQNISSMFRNSSCVNLDLSTWDVSNVTDMSDMFYNCSGLTSLNITGWDTSSVTNFYEMFCYARSLPLTNVLPYIKVTNNVTTSLGAMFRGNSVTTSYDLRHWDISGLSTLSALFMECTGLTSVDLTGWDASNITDIQSMFYGCTGLTSFTFPNINLINVNNIYSLFSGCTNLTTLDLSNIKGNITNAYQTFSGCTRLSTLDISGFDLTGATSYNNMFGSRTTNYVPADCLIYVKDQTQKDWFTTNFSRLTNVQIKS